MVSPDDVKPKKKGSSPFVMMAAFLFVILIMFDNNLRLATGDFVGYLLNPVASLWGFHILWTLLFASVVMIITTSIIRHFLVDWVHMARTQEVMRTFQKEFGKARKENNTYKIKRLTEKQPEIMQLQADMSTGQLKPMAFTMLFVIPIFAWLSTITLAPVAYDVDAQGATDPALLIATGPDLQDAILVQDGSEELSFLTAAHVQALAPPGATPTGTIRIDHPKTTRDATLDLAAAPAPEWSTYRVASLDAGTYVATPEGPYVNFVVDDDTHRTLSHLLLLVPDGGDISQAEAVFVNGNGATFTIDSAGTTIYALIPVEAGTTPTGGITDIVRPEGSDNVVATWELTVESNLYSVEIGGAADAVLVPHAARLPWNEASDLNGTWWVMPHWILLYSLFSIPIGQLTQKLLKLIEYSKVDLDADGKTPGLDA